MKQYTIASFIKENKIETIVFIVLWTLVILRSFLVFYVHDEIVSKYAYMLDWNPIPFSGYIDANNHFLNSLLGGFFIRLFHSEAIWVCRLPNVLAFPIFFWSIVGFKRFFRERASYMLYLVSLGCTVFLLDFFSLARGYGLAWSFLLLAILSTANYITSNTFKNLIWAIGAWVLSVYANLSVITVALIGVALLFVVAFQGKRKQHLFLLGGSFILSSGAIYYALFLQKIGKLYLGNKDDFISTTLQNLTDLLFSIKAFYLEAIILLIFILVTIRLIYSLYRSQLKIKVDQLFYIFLVLSVLAIFAQNVMLSVNFPEDRSAGFLVIFFYGSLCFIFDQFRLKLISWLLSGLLLICFVTQANLTHTRTYYYEHMDKDLISLIPPLTKGIPTSTGGRFWNMDNELIKSEQFPPFTFQPSGFGDDTLTDYIIHRPSLRPYIEKVYTVHHEDPISGLVLYQRRKFLEREKKTDVQLAIESKEEYIGLTKQALETPCFVRVTGKLKKVDFYDQLNVIVVAQDSLDGRDHFGETLSLLERIKVNEHGKISFDFTYTIKTHDKINELEVFMHNRKQIPLEGIVRVQVYQIQ